MNDSKNEECLKLKSRWLANSFGKKLKTPKQ